MGAAEPDRLAPSNAVTVTNPEGSSPYVLVCDHASNFVPPPYGTLGLEPADLERHIAWDPGALPVARRMAAALDATLIESCVSRLVIDCNRALHAPDLILEVSVSERIVVPANQQLSADEREARIALSWRPFHDAIETIVGSRLARGHDTALVSVHSFTPVFRGRERPWQIGIVHDEDVRLSHPFVAALERVGGLTVGDNQPYSPADGVYYTLERHARSRGLASVMIEIRNDEIRDDKGQSLWAGRLGDILAALAGIWDHHEDETRTTGRLGVRQTISRGR
jgi:predicted N-formylglutamate amidohydrolase